MTERVARQAVIRLATVLAVTRDFPSSPVFGRWLGYLADVLPQIPDHPDDPLYALCRACEALIDARLDPIGADWPTLRHRLQGALHDYSVIAATQAVEAFEARSGR